MQILKNVKMNNTLCFLRLLSLITPNKLALKKNLFPSQVLWADGRISWLKECNLPPFIKECLKEGKSYQQKVVSLNEFAQKRLEYKLQETPTTATKEVNIPYTPALIRYTCPDKNTM